MWLSSERLEQLRRRFDGGHQEVAVSDERRLELAQAEPPGGPEDMMFLRPAAEDVVHALAQVGRDRVDVHPPSQDDEPGLRAVALPELLDDAQPPGLALLDRHRAKRKLVGRDGVPFVQHTMERRQEGDALDRLPPAQTPGERQPGELAGVEFWRRRGSVQLGLRASDQADADHASLRRKLGMSSRGSSGGSILVGGAELIALASARRAGCSVRSNSEGITGWPSWSS